MRFATYQPHDSTAKIALHSTNVAARLCRKHKRIFGIHHLWWVAAVPVAGSADRRTKRMRHALRQSLCRLRTVRSMSKLFRGEVRGVCLWMGMGNAFASGNERRIILLCLGRTHRDSLSVQSWFVSAVENIEIHSHIYARQSPYKNIVHTTYSQ